MILGWQEMMNLGIIAHHFPTPCKENGRCCKSDKILKLNKGEEEQMPKKEETKETHPSSHPPPPPPFPPPPHKEIQSASHQPTPFPPPPNKQIQSASHQPTPLPPPPHQTSSCTQNLKTGKRDYIGNYP